VVIIAGDAKSTRFSRLPGNRKGITPVIAIVLLLMMTVAAAGGAWVWMTQVREDIQDDVNPNADFTIQSLSCENTGGNAQITMFIKNTGETQLDTSNVDVQVHDISTGTINSTLTQTNVDISTYLTDGSGFADPTQSGTYQVSISGTSFDTLTSYEVHVILNEEGGTKDFSSCEP
jgi:flagellin-like protein